MSRAALAALALVALLAAGRGVTSSGADFVATTSSPANSFDSATDFNTVAVAMTDPGTPLRGAVPLQAVASSDRGIERVRFQSSPAGADSWTDACQATAAPYSCDWDTSAVPDGPRDVRALAVDQAGYQRASAVRTDRLVDNTAPAVALDDPGYLQGTETLSATSSDAGSGVASLAIDYRPAGGAWTTLCTGPAPHSCPLDTSGMPEGPYELRAQVTDEAGNAGEAYLTRVLDNTAPTASVVAPAGPLRGTVTIGFTAGDGAGSGVKQLTAEQRSSGGGPWTPLCADAQAPYECAGFDTTQVADGLYDIRVTAEDDSGLATTASAVTVRVDNTAPSTATLANPGTNLQGSVAMNGTAVDAGAGIAAWIVQYRPAGGGAWVDACSDASSPYGCNWNTTTVADALYDLRAVARDQAGNETAATTLAGRRVDNNGPTVALADPGAYLRGTVALTATATDPAGIQSVIFERKPTSGSTWTTICTDNATPFTCSFNTTGVADGTYDLRARAVDTVAHEYSSTVTGRVIDNTAPGAAAVDSGDGGGTPGLLQQGDWLRLTWTEPIAPASVLAGWDGTPLAVRVELQDVGANDELNLWNGAATTRLNLVDSLVNLQLNENYVTTNGWFNATMTRSGAAIAITLGTKISGTLVTAARANISWKPSILATDLAGNPSTATAVSEPNPKDLDF